MSNVQRIPKIKIDKISQNTKVAVITALWNTDLTQNMESECLKELNKHKIKITTIKVAGSFELIAAAKVALVKKYDAIVVLGVVLNGETPHFDYVCQAVTKGMTELAVEYGKPIGFGVLTCN
ncbi:MAG: 6,7-dimethyl-8-ribityllumazine synthase, partial [Actinomycetes bacterium]